MPFQSIVCMQQDGMIQVVVHCNNSGIISATVSAIWHYRYLLSNKSSSCYMCAIPSDASDACESQMSDIITADTCMLSVSTGLHRTRCGTASDIAEMSIVPAVSELQLQHLVILSPSMLLEAMFDPASVGKVVALQQVSHCISWKDLSCW